MFRWFHENLILNLKHGKTEYVIYGTARNLKSQLPCYVNILGTSIHQETKYEYMGVTLDQHLAMSDQTSKVFKKVNQRVNLLKIVRINIESSSAHTIYRSMIEPIMLYCAPLYPGIAPLRSKLTKLENKAYEIIGTKNLKPINRKTKERTAVEAFKYLHGIKRNADIKRFEHSHHCIGTRGNGNRLVMPRSKTEAGRRSFIVQGALVFNELPEPICNFKRSISDFKF